MTPENAINSTAFPCNPVPFAARIAELTTGNTDAIRSEAVRACLLVLCQQSWGQLATVDTYTESVRYMHQLDETGALATTTPNNGSER